MHSGFRNRLKVISYIVFTVCLFLIENLPFYFFCLALTFLLSLNVPFKHLKRGVVPITVFLVFTFLSNVFLRQGQIIFSLGSFVITDEGLTLALIRTLRVFLMIVMAKIFTAATPIDVFMATMGNMLSPLQRIKIPVADFFSIAGLALKCLPGLMGHISDTYRENIKDSEAKSINSRIRITASFLMPLFIESMQSPEKFFE